MAGEADAAETVSAYYRDADSTRFALHDAQLVVARTYGFESWPKLKAAVEGIKGPETDSEPWATPRAWAEKMNHPDVIRVLGDAG